MTKYRIERWRRPAPIRVARRRAAVASQPINLPVTRQDVGSNELSEMMLTNNVCYIPL